MPVLPTTAQTQPGYKVVLWTPDGEWEVVGPFPWADLRSAGYAVLLDAR